MILQIGLYFYLVCGFDWIVQSYISKYIMMIYMNEHIKLLLSLLVYNMKYDAIYYNIIGI